MKKTDQSIRNSVIAGLVVTVIIAAVRPFRNLVVVVAKWFWSALVTIWKHLMATAFIPWWLVYAAVAILLLLVVRAIRAYLTDLAEETAKESPLSYTSDRFHGLVWRWKMDSDFQPYTILTFCPRCDMQLHPDMPGYSPTQFDCDKCGFTSETIKMTSNELEHWVYREIQRVLRTQEWKERMPNQASHCTK
jgi:hypothetical protein